MRPVRTAARAMLAATFVIQGWQALRNPAKLAGRAATVTDRLAPTIAAVHPKLPTDAETLVRVNGATQVVGGLLLATGHATTPAALALAGSLVPTTLAGHRYWEYEDPAERNQHRISFLKNVGLIGGLIFAALDNEGRPSVGWRANELAHRAGRFTGREARHLAKETRRAAQSTRRAARSTRREAQLALRATQLKATQLGRRLPG